MKTTNPITLNFKNVMKAYRSHMPIASTVDIRNRMLFNDQPHLDRGRMWNRTLFDMNNYSEKCDSTTGICTPVAMFVLQRLTEQGIDAKLLTLRTESRNIFLHTIIYSAGRFYDAFYPEGVEDWSVMLDGHKCKLVEENDDIIEGCEKYLDMEFLNKHLFSKVEIK